jgi:hypothetical protein
MRNLTIAVCALGFGLLVAVLLAELVVRVAGVTSEIPYLPNSEFGWSHAPGARFDKIVEGSAVPIEINDHGLHDDPHDYAKPDGVLRILVLGDSFAEAVQVPREQNFSSRLETLASQALAADVEVINAGTSGYGTDNELLFYRHEGYRYEPDIVLLALYVGNDIRNNWFELENIDAGGFRKPYFTLDGGGLKLNPNPNDVTKLPSTRVKTFLNRNSRLFAFGRELRDRWRARGTAGGTSGLAFDFALFRSEYPAEWQAAWQITDRLLAQLDEDARSHGAQLFVVLIPTVFQVEPVRWTAMTEAAATAAPGAAWDVDKPNRLLADMLAARGIAYVDLLEPLRRAYAADGRALYLPVDAHWNAVGHEKAAELIAAALAADAARAAQ